MELSVDEVMRRSLSLGGSMWLGCLFARFTVSSSDVVPDAELCVLFHSTDVANHRGRDASLPDRCDDS